MKLAYVIAAAVAVAAWIGYRQVRSSRSVSFPNDLDGSVLNQLVQAGSDLSKAHQPEFFLYFPDEMAAERVAKVLKADGFQVSVKHAATGDNWLCLATKTMVLTHEGMTAIRRRLVLLADENHGEYDGWGTPIAR